MADELYLKVQSTSVDKTIVTYEAKRQRYVGEVGEVGYIFRFKATITKVSYDNYTLTLSDMQMKGINGSNSTSHKLTGTIGVTIDGKNYSLKNWNNQSGYYANYNYSSFVSIAGLDGTIKKENLTRNQILNARIYVTDLGCTKWSIYNYMTITANVKAGFAPKADGSFVMIGTEKYYPVIGNGEGVSRYNIQIGSDKY